MWTLNKLQISQCEPHCKQCNILVIIIWFRCGLQRQPLCGWLSIMYKEENPVLQSNTPCLMYYMYKKTLILCKVNYNNKLLYSLYIQLIPCKQLYLYDLSNAQFLEAEILWHSYLYKTLHVNEITCLLCVKLTFYYKLCVQNSLMNLIILFDMYTNRCLLLLDNT